MSDVARYSEVTARSAADNSLPGHCTASKCRGACMSSNKTSHLMDKMYDPVRSRSYIALDVPTADTALEWVSLFGDAVDGYKVGLQLFHAAGQSLIQELLKRNKRIFLDVKLHDIPNTVAGALTAICQYPIEMVNVHALGGL